MLRSDERLDDTPMRPVRCRQCGADVQVRKSSWQQTSVQWSADAMAACVERQESTPRPGPNGGSFLVCQALGESIRDAARAGSIDVPED